MSRLLVVLALLVAGGVARAQSPEIALREFASGQIKKGVRSIGFGGDGATWGNYALVWRDEGTALLDGGATSYLNGNYFSFTAAAVTLPSLWHGLTFYAIALSQTATGIHLQLKSPGLGPHPVAMRGDGSNQAIFLKAAMPIGKGFSIGILLSYEISQFDAASETGPTEVVRYRTHWRPSGGLGLTWQPNPRLLLGVRMILNHDEESRTDSLGERQALARSYEFRAGISGSPWKGALLDLGGTLLDRSNGLAGTETIGGGANIGIEQAFWNRSLVLRAGVDECKFSDDCTATAGISVKVEPINLDVAYLYDLGRGRIGTLFGQHSHSVLATLTLDYGWIYRHFKHG